MAVTERRDVVLLRPAEASQAKQDIPVFFGVSEKSAGARGLCMNLTAFPPGGKSNAHMHRDHETAIYHLEGKVALFYGEKLENHVVLEPGSFCYIPPFLPHRAFNLSTTEPALSVTSRDDANEQENVIPTPEADDGSADERVKALMA